MLRRIFCLLCALTVLSCASFSSFASGMELGTGIPVELGVDVVSLADMAWKAGVGVGNFLRHFMDEDVCPMCTDLTAQHDFVPKRTLIDGKVGFYYVCRYCGRSAGEVMDTSYQDYVQTLPAMQYNSDGGFLWRPSPDILRGQIESGINWVNFYNGSNSFVLRCRMDGTRTVSGASSCWVVPGESICFSQGAAHDWRYMMSLSFISPYDAFYQCAVPSSYPSFLDGSYVQGVTVSTGFSFKSQESFISIDWPAFWVVPVVPVSDFAGDTRISGAVSDGGMFGYVENGQLYQSTVTNIYNEATGAYQNPVTGDTSSVSSWAYDYSTRSYMLTTSEGDEITVAYGDSNVTINEGGTTYNLYYLMEETAEIREELESDCVHNYASVETTPPTCTASGVRTLTCVVCGDSYVQTVLPTGHDYASAVTLSPMCVGTGVRTFTCNNCGDSYTVSIPATGHVWHVVSSVATTYDAITGELVQQGYSLYECDVCQEQYRINSEVGGSSLPAPSTGGVSTGGADLLELDSDVGRGFLATIARGLTKDLPDVVQAASSWFVELPSLYEGYTGFLAASVAWLPHDIQVLMTFSVGITTFVGIIRKIWGGR